jgi:hypothetical protein
MEFLKTAPPLPLLPEARVRGENRRRRERALEILIVLAAVVIAAGSARDFACSANDASRLATVECLVDYHTFAIDRSMWFEQTCDKIRPRPDGPFFSHQPPVLALLLAAPYQGMQSVFGMRAAEHKGVFCYLLTFLSAGLAYIVAVWCVFRLFPPASPTSLPSGASFGWAASSAYRPAGPPR